MSDDIQEIIDPEDPSGESDQNDDPIDDSDDFELIDDSDDVVTTLPINEEEIGYISVDDDSTTLLNEDADDTLENDDADNPDSLEDESVDLEIEYQDISLTDIDVEADGITDVGGEDIPILSDPELIELVEPATETAVVKVRIVIEDYRPESLQGLYNQGAKFFVVYDDETEDEVLWTEIVEPTHTATSQLVLDATQIGGASNQHFWDDTNGAHVTSNTRDSWNAEYDKVDHGALSNPTDLEPWNNILINAFGILLRRGLINLTAFSRNAFYFYDGYGNTSSNILAFFGNRTVQIGKDTEKHIVINANGVTAYNSDGTIAPITGVFDGANISNSTITSSKIVDGTITGSKIADASITGAKIQGSTLTNIPYAEIDQLKTRNVSADSIAVATSYVGALTAGSITANDIIADNARIDDLESSRVTTSYLEANYIDADTIEAGYAQIDFSNVTAAWIQNGTIKDGAITNAMINSVSANKLTAGTIDASNITVTNLNADNITAGTINGQRLGVNSISLDKLTEDVYTEQEIDSIVDGLNDRIDGAIETYTGTDIPTLNNTPASQWNTDDLKNSHVGDVYYVVNSSSQQNGYSYRFTKSIDNQTVTYSWQLIKDSDVTAALSRLQTAEGKISTIETFDATVTSFMSNTNDELTSVKNRATSLETRIGSAENSLSTKVETSVFNTLSQAVDANTSSISSLSETVEEKADGSTVTSLSNTVNSHTQTINTTSSHLSSLTTTLGVNADGTTKSGDILHQISDVSQDLTSYKTTVSSTYATIDGLTGLTNRVSQAETDIEQNATDILLKANASDTYTKNETSALLSVKANLDTLTSEINASADTVKIDANRVNISGAALFTSGRLSESSLNNTYEAYGASTNKADKTAAVYRQQLIYISQPANTLSVAVNETWVTTSSDSQNVWTTKRPTYNSSYPVLFVATQQQTVAQSSGTTCTCTTPLKDDTTTVIDGGHITTGTIDSNRINASALIVGGSTLSSIAETVDSTLIYDHTYEFNQNHTQATFTAHLFRGGVDVKTEFDSSQFTWYSKTEASDELTYIGSGYTCTVTLASMGYGGHIVGKFVSAQDVSLQTSNNRQLLSNDEQVTIRSSEDGSVRISDLSVATGLYSTDKLMVSGTEDEHLITVATLQGYLESNLTKQVSFGTTSQWNTQVNLASDAGTIYIYTDHAVDKLGNTIAGIKIGDGSSYLIDLPFTDAILMDHISDTTSHITAAERTTWNNKVRCYFTGTEQLVFTTN